MARYTFRLPDIGEGIAEAEIVAWHVGPGDRIEEDGRLADMMTDKATVEMESPVAGTVLEVAGEVGERVAIGAALAVIEVAGDAADDADPAPQAVPVARPSEAVDLGEGAEIGANGGGGPMLSRPDDADRPGRPVRQANVQPAARPAPPEPGAALELSSPHNPKVLASPAVRARAGELGIDLAHVRPAADGRVRHADLDAFLAYARDEGYAVTGDAMADRQVRLVGLRRRSAENVAAAKRHIPHFSYVEECDVTAFESLRAQLNGGRGERPKLTMLPLLIVAICRTVPAFPMMNARFDDEAGVVTRHGAVHLGVATRTAAGLMVPVIRNAQTLNLWQLAREIARLAQAARDGTARSDELAGSTLTITSLGALGGIAATPIVNRPEVAIIAPNRIVERPMFVPDGLGGERIEKRKVMNLSLSCDHRVIDGWEAASFVQALKRLVEAPARLLAG